METNKCSFFVTDRQTDRQTHMHHNIYIINIIVLIMVIYIALRVPHKQTSQCKDAWIRGLPATNSIPVKKRKSLKSHKLSQSTNNPRSSPAYAVYFLTWVWGTLTGFLPFLVREAVKQS